MRQSRLLGLLAKDRQWYYDLGWFRYNEGSNHICTNLKPIYLWYNGRNGVNGFSIAVTTTAEFDEDMHTICVGSTGGAILNVGPDVGGCGGIVELDLNKINQATGKKIKKGNSIKFGIENISAGGIDKTYNNSFHWAIIKTNIDMNYYNTHTSNGHPDYYHQQDVPLTDILLRGTFSVNLNTDSNLLDPTYYFEESRTEARFFLEDDISHTTPIFCGKTQNHQNRFFHLGQPQQKDANIIKDKSKYFSQDKVPNGKIYLVIWGAPVDNKENFHIKPEYLTSKGSGWFSLNDGKGGVHVAIGYLAPSEYKQRN